MLLRSFSALELSLIAAYDNKKEVLTDEEFAQLLNSAISYMNAERDLRGYDPQKGWMHATAHTADLLQFLARNPRLKPPDQAKILDAIAAKLHQDGHAFTFGENERMAAAVLSLVRRKDFHQNSFESWLARFPAESAALWAAPKLNLAQFAAIQNTKDLLRSVVVQLDSSEQLDSKTENAKQATLACLRKLI